VPATAATTPSAYWYVTRGTGTAALVLLTLSVALGIANVRRTEIEGVPRFVLNSVHRNVSLLAVTFLALHIVTTLLDGFAPISVLDVFLPFKSSYRPIWLGLGVVAFDLMIAITVTSLLRLRLGYEAWRVTHWLAYVSWPLALVHGFGTGTDAKTGWMLAVSGVCVVVVVIAVMLRAIAGWPAHLVARVSAIGAAAVFPIGLVAWLPGGPLGEGWAKRAGTPSYLLARASGAPAASPSSPAAAPAASRSSNGSFTAPATGQVRQAQLARGMTLVDISLAIGNEHLSNLHIRLRGEAIAGGGVEMTTSRVTLGPAANPDEYSGRVTALQGTDIQASLTGPSGSGFTVLARMQIAAGSSTANGTVTATALAGAR
jgi:hypothetical protein